MKHLSKKDIISLIVHGSSHTGKQTQERHLSECATCQKTYHDFLKIYQSSGNSALEVPAGCEKRILATYHETVNRIPVKSPFHLKKLMALPKPAFSLAAILIAAATIGLVLYYSGIPRHESFIPDTVQFEVLNKSAVINGSRISQSKNLTRGDHIQVPSEGLSLLVHKGLFQIVLSGPGDLKLQKAECSKEKNHFRHHFLFNAGRLIAFFQKEEVTNEYSFKTPHARIDSIGTSCMVSVSSDMTSLYLASGSCRITAVDSGLTMQCVPGNRYDVTGSIQQSPLHKNTVNSITAMRFPEEPRLENSSGKQQTQQKKKQKNQAAPRDTELQKGNYSKSQQRTTLKEMKSETRQIRNTMRKNKASSQENAQEMRQLRNQHRGH